MSWQRLLRTSSNGPRRIQRWWKRETRQGSSHAKSHARCSRSSTPEYQEHPPEVILGPRQIASVELWSVRTLRERIDSMLYSCWIAQLQRQIQLCFPRLAMPSRRHIAVTFQDSTFEAVTETVSGIVLNEHRLSVLSRVTQLLWGDS